MPAHTSHSDSPNGLVVYSVGLTGGIASGKSTIASRMVALGAQHVDADQLARAAVEPGAQSLDLIRRRFGDEVFEHDGSLNRRALGAQVFADSAALSSLNAILHPAIASLRDELVDHILETDQNAVIVFDAALLVESGQTDRFDIVVVASASETLRVQRMIDARGMSEEEARQRIRAQASEEDRRALADVVIDTSGTLEHTLRQVDALYNRIILAQVH